MASTTQRSLIDQLLKDLFSKEEPYGLKDTRGYSMLALQVALLDDSSSENIVLRAHQLLDQRCVKVCTMEQVPNGSILDWNLLLSPYSMVIVEEFGTGGKHLVDLEQWFCSCGRFLQRFNATGTEISVTTAQPTAMEVEYGHRSHPNIQFALSLSTDQALGTTYEDKVPICEHLLALYLCKLHSHKLLPLVVISEVTQREFIQLNTRLISNANE